MQNFIDHHTFLIQNNLLTDEMKENIAMCAWILVESTIDASTAIDFNTKVISYRLSLPKVLTDNMNLLNRYKKDPKSLGFFETRRLNKFLTKKANNDETGLHYDLKAIAERFIHAYLSKDWSVKVEYRYFSSEIDQRLWLDEHVIGES